MPILFEAMFKEAEVYSGGLAAWGPSRAWGREMSCRGNGKHQTIESSCAVGKHTAHSRSSPYSPLKQEGLTHLHREQHKGLTDCFF